MQHWEAARAMLSLVSILTVLIVSTVIETAYGTPYVTIKQGRLFGETIDFQEDGIDVQVDAFKGIPFAETPERFQPPEAKRPWDEDWNATYYRSACMQAPASSWRPWYNVTVNEDCLYLNVYAPHPKPSNAAVMVYIHGGSYNMGSAMVDDFSGIPLAAFEQVILVAINYRLNVFGFLSTGDSASRGNFGLLDQAEALKWVRENIGAFGGNNESVTIFGESAGAGSVDFHRFSKYSRDLFDRGILQSGASLAPWSYRSDPNLERRQSRSLGRALGCEIDDTFVLVECLRSVSAEELYEAYVKSGRVWMPNLDGIFLDESPRAMLNRGDFKQSPILVGFNKDEGTISVASYYPDYINNDTPPFVDRGSFDYMTSSCLWYTYGFTNDLMENVVKQEYIDWSQSDNSSADYFLTYLPIPGDSGTCCPAMEITRAHSLSTEPVFQYFFTHVPHTSYYERDDMGTGWFLAGHQDELPFVFGWGFSPDLKDRHYMSLDEKMLSRKMMQFWANFAKTGDPSKMSPSNSPGIGEMEWPMYSAPDLFYKELSLNMTIGRGLKADECTLWNDLMNQLIMYLVSMPEAELQWREDYDAWKTDLNSWQLEFETYNDRDTCL